MPLMNLDEIDFSQPDGEFIYKGQTYQVKHYANTYFFKNKKHNGFEFIFYFFDDVEDTEYYFPEKSFAQIVEQIIQKEHSNIRRCIQYKEAIFSFGIWNGRYYLPEYNNWRNIEWLNCNLPKVESLDELLEKPYEFFAEPAAILYKQELPLLEDEEKFYAFI